MDDEQEFAEGDSSPAERQESCVDFCGRVLKDHRGKTVQLAPLHRSWHEHIEYCWETLQKHPVIFAPWGHGKTVQIVLGRVLYELGLRPESRIKLVCNTHETARLRVMQLAQYIEYDEDLHEWFPQLRRPKGRGGCWTQDRFSLKGIEGARSIDPSVQGAGILSTGIGGRADLVVFDDVVDRRNALDSPRLQTKVIPNFFETWLSRLDGMEGRSVTIMTLWQRDDLGHKLMDNPEFCVLKQAVNDNLSMLNCELFNGDDGHPIWQSANQRNGQWRLPLWDEKWPKEALMRKKREHLRAFERGFQQKAFSAEEVMFPSFKKNFVDFTKEEVLRKYA